MRTEIDRQRDRERELEERGRWFDRLAQHRKARAEAERRELEKENRRPDRVRVREDTERRRRATSDRAVRDRIAAAHAARSAEWDRFEPYAKLLKTIETERAKAHGLVNRSLADIDLEGAVVALLREDALSRLDQRARDVIRAKFPRRTMPPDVDVVR